MSQLIQHMRGRSRIARLAGLVLGGVTLALALAGCKEEITGAGEPVRPVKAVVLARSEEMRRITLSGAVKARVESTIGFRVPGKIVERLVDVGARVEPGTPIARLDPADSLLNLHSAEAAVEAAKSRRDVAVDALQRNKALFEKGFVSRSALDQRTLENEQASAGYDAAVFARDQAANQTRYNELAADAAGIVTEIRADAGQVVSAGTPVAVIARDGDKEVAIAVPESEIGHFQVGQAVVVHYWADAAIVHNGRVREIAGSADASSRTFAVKVSLPADGRIRLGQTASVEADIPIGNSGLVVPLAALAEHDGQPVVWVADRASSTVAPRPVSIAAAAEEGVRIAEGVAPGDLIVTAGTQFLTPGKKVKLPLVALETASAEAIR